jgi:hypothetical protein
MPWTRGSRAGRDRGVREPGDRRQVVDLGGAEPGALAAQAVERRQAGGVAVEVVLAHAVDHQEQHETRSSRRSSAKRRLWLRPEHVDGIETRGERRASAPCPGARPAAGTRRSARTGSVQEERDVAVVGPGTAVHEDGRGAALRDHVPGRGHDRELPGTPRIVRAREAPQQLLAGSGCVRRRPRGSRSRRAAARRTRRPPVAWSALSPPLRGRGSDHSVRVQSVEF